jgi:two-component system chemotaxis family response regulator WspR
MLGNTMVIVAPDDAAADSLRQRVAAEGCRVLSDDLSTGGTRPTCILVVEHDPRQRQLLERALLTPGRPMLQVVFAADVADACRQIAADRFACVVLRHRLRDGLGVDVLDEMEESLLTTPVVAISDVDDPQVATSYFRRGCVEFIAPWDVFEPDALRRRVTEATSRFHRRAMATIIDRGQLSRGIIDSQEHLIALARTDRLLGICNRAVFDDAHADLHRQARERGEAYALVMIDLDRFKSFNDCFGHAAGDECLRTVASCIAGAARHGDLVARYGGEEIVVLLRQACPADAALEAERLRAAVESLALPHEANDHHGRVTVSMGVATFDGAGDLDAAAVLRRADEALYRAKRGGRNRVELASAIAAVDPGATGGLAASDSVHS